MVASWQIHSSTKRTSSSVSLFVLCCIALAQPISTAMVEGELPIELSQGMMDKLFKKAPPQVVTVEDHAGNEKDCAPAVQCETSQKAKTPSAQRDIAPQKIFPAKELQAKPATPEGKLRVNRYVIVPF